MIEKCQCCGKEYNADKYEISALETINDEKGRVWRFCSLKCAKRGLPRRKR